MVLMPQFVIKLSLRIGTTFFLYNKIPVQYSKSRLILQAFQRNYATSQKDRRLTGFCTYDIITKIDRKAAFQQKQHIMTQVNITRVHRWYGWILAVVLAALGILFILSSLDIYTSGPEPYTPESIGLRFQRILIPVIIGICGIIGSMALNFFLPLPEKRAKGILFAKDQMLRFRKKASIAPVKKEVRLRFILCAATALCFIGLMIDPIFYFLDQKHFTGPNLNTDIIRAIIIALVPAIIGLVLCWICQLLLNQSYRREATIYKQAWADGQRASSINPTNKRKKCSCKVILPIRLVVITLALVLIILGIFNGGAADVLKKAIIICTECIGLG